MIYNIKTIMQRWKKVSDKVKAEIISMKLQNPDMSHREIHRWLPSIKSNKTVSTIVKNEFTQNTQKYDEIVDKNLEIIKKWQEILLTKMDTIDVNNMKDLWVLSNVLYHSVRQNKMIEGYYDDSWKELIPSNINIQVISN